MTGGTWNAIELGADLRPSNGRIIASGDTRESVERHWIPGRIVIAWAPAHAPIRRISTEALAALRQKRLRRRVERDAPLFAAQLIADELAKRPAYYAGERPE